MAITDTTKQQAFLRETSDVFLILLTVSHADISDINLVNNNENITSNSVVFTAMPFTITLPDSKENAPPRSTVTIDNVSREISTHIRNITTPPTITISVIRAAAPDTLEITFAPLTLRNVHWDFTTLSGELVGENMEAEPYPAGQMSPAFFPSIF
ncbi:MAG: DUF1833 family protein [Candidatus Scalindua sp.]|jgi:hypothetical protein|nr:DUF1833 family protein [Candidatus Scalindua sp.]